MKKSKNLELDKLLGGGISLDVDCGENKQSGFIGMDAKDLPGVDVVHNYADIPWPLKDNSCDRVILSYVLEHVLDTVALMTEVHRICKHGATVMIAVPYWQSIAAWEDPTHVRCFNENTFNYFEDKSPKFHVEDVSYSYMGNMEVILTVAKESNSESETG